VRRCRVSWLLRPALTVFIVLSVVTGLLYPGVVTGIARAVFPHRQRLADRQGRQDRRLRADRPAVLGPKYFWGRLSATAPMPYNARRRAAQTWGRPIRR
jgi:K+-transporting ATPase ATPase C chain